MDQIQIKERYKGIDICKFICIFLVVMIHVAPCGGDDGQINYILQKIIARISVPFFFTVSGFLLFRKFEPNSIEPARIKKFLFSNLRLYLIWSLIYSPFILHGILTADGGLLRGVLIAVRNFFLTGSYTHLWYLNALIISVVIIWIMMKKGLNIEKILGISLILFLVGLLGQTYFGLLLPLKNYDGIWNALKLIQKIIGTTRNAVFEGLFFVSLGIIFAWNEKRLTRGYNTVLIPIAGMLLLLAEGLLIKNYGHPLQWNTYFCSALAVFLFFRYAINTDKNWSISDRTCRWFRDITEIVFLLHLWIRAIVDVLISRTAPMLHDTCIRYILVCFFSIAFGQLIIVLSNKERFRFLKILL